MWLAFSGKFSTFCRAFQSCNTNEETEETEGKLSWFPLLDGAPRLAGIIDVNAMKSLSLLDPTIKEHVRLIEVKMMDEWASRFCLSTKIGQEFQIDNLIWSKLASSKRCSLRVMRDIQKQADDLLKFLMAAEANIVVADALPVDGKLEALQKNAPSNHMLLQRAHSCV